MKISFRVDGEPIPQGSTKSFYIKKLDRVVTTHANKGTEGWRLRIAAEAQHENAELEAIGERFYRIKRKDGIDDGVKITVDFFLSAPKCAKKGAKPTKLPDLDKLARAALDALTGVLFDDDSQVLDLEVHKRYKAEDCPPGANVTVEAV